MLRKVAILTLGLMCLLGVSACTDPNSPVDPTHQPTRGVMRDKDANVYAGGAIVFYYLRIAADYGTYWVTEDAEDWVECQVNESWSRALGCLE